MTPYFDRDGIVIYNARCEDVLPSIDPATVDLLLTDPPYGINLDTDYAQMKYEGGGPGKVYASVAADDAPFDPVHLLTFGRCVVWGANNFSDKLPAGRWLTWDKVNPHPFQAAAELAWHNCGGRSVDVFRQSVAFTKAKDGAVHPTQKPVGLMRWIIDKWTKPGDLVLDPYMGSGPVAQACHELGRRYIGIELVEDYCKVAVSRLAQQTLDLSGGAA